MLIYENKNIMSKWTKGIMLKKCRFQLSAYKVDGLISWTFRDTDDNLLYLSTTITANNLDIALQFHLIRLKFVDIYIGIVDRIKQAGFFWLNG